jgi:hypothetical protein
VPYQTRQDVAFFMGRTFKLITMPFRPFQHPIEVDVQIARLRRAQRRLAADGASWHVK